MPSVPRIRDFFLDSMIILLVLFFAPVILGQITLLALIFLVALAVILLSAQLAKGDGKGQFKYIVFTVVVLLLLVFYLLVPGTQITLPIIDLPF